MTLADKSCHTQLQLTFELYTGSDELKARKFSFWGSTSHSQMNPSALSIQKFFHDSWPCFIPFQFYWCMFIEREQCYMNMSMKRNSWNHLWLFRKSASRRDENFVREVVRQSRFSWDMTKERVTNWTVISDRYDFVNDFANFYNFSIIILEKSGNN